MERGWLARLVLACGIAFINEAVAPSLFTHFCDCGCLKAVSEQTLYVWSDFRSCLNLCYCQNWVEAVARVIYSIRTGESLAFSKVSPK